MIARIPPEILDACSRIASAASLPQENLVGVVQVESSGQPYEPADGSTPTMRAEPRHFWRRLPEGKRAAAVAARLAAPKGTPVSYASQGSSAARLQLFAAMCALDENAAYESCSWGLGQILGENAVGMGYPSARAMVEDFRTGGIDAQINGIVRYCSMVGCLNDLRQGRWTPLAVAYNGPEQEGYDAKLARAVADWHVRLTSGQTQPPADPAVLSIGSEGSEVTRVQTLLAGLGYPVVADGHYGQKTHAAVAAYQAQHGLPADGLCGPQTMAMLVSSVPVAQGTRDLATTDSLAATTETGFGARLIKRISVATGVGSVGGKTVLDTVNGHLERVNELSWKAEASLLKLLEVVRATSDSRYWEIKRLEAEVSTLKATK